MQLSPHFNCRTFTSPQNNLCPFALCFTLYSCIVLNTPTQFSSNPYHQIMNSLYKIDLRFREVTYLSHIASMLYNQN